MRSFYILPLHFTTPVHFGSVGYGGGLEMAGMTCPADTLFSALCVEAVRLGGDALAALTAKAERGDIAFSDLLPCRWEAGEWQWYLPKPVLSMPVKAEARQTLGEAREASSFRKKSKKRAFLRASELSLYIDDLRFGENSLEEEPTFASLSVIPITMEGSLVPMRQAASPLPRMQGFTSCCGLRMRKTFHQCLPFSTCSGFPASVDAARAGWENLNSAQIPSSSPRAPRKRIPAPSMSF